MNDRLQNIFGGLIGLIVSGLVWFLTQTNDDVRSNKHSIDTHVTVSDARVEAVEQSLLKNWDFDDATNEKFLEYIIAQHEKELKQEHRTTRLETIQEMREKWGIK